jgi:hypothetical protein
MIAPRELDVEPPERCHDTRLWVLARACAVIEFVTDLQFLGLSLSPAPETRLTPRP